MNPKRVLVINVSRIGDTLLVTPALNALSVAWPDAKIDVLGHPGRVEVLANLPFLNRIGSITKNSARIRGRFPTREKSYDLAIVYGFDASLVAYALRVAHQVVAYRQQDELLNARLWKVVTPPAFKSDHAVHLGLRLVAALDIAPADLRLKYCVTSDEKAWAGNRLQDDLPDETYPLVGLQVASFPTKAYRDWPIESFIALCQRIRTAHPNAHFAIFGGTEERVRTSVLAENLGASATIYAGKLSLRQTGALMSLIDLYVGVDTGPTHMMSCFDVPMVVLYHGFSPSTLIAPLDHPCLFAIDHPLAGPECGTDAKMSDISVDQVWNAVSHAVAENPRR